ncbi:MAG: hypothetical protein QM579_13945 [Desulfovibrio sp.]|uniref:hypothetical protein n=1 Tax=Desulfovibrio sp. TaxID=885 RepID=UPI0039E42AB3
MSKKSKNTEPETAENNDSAEARAHKEAQAAAEGKNRMHYEGLGDAWAVLTGQNPAAIMDQIVSTVLHEGGTRPSWQWKRGSTDHILMAWPQDQPLRASVLVTGEEGEKLTPISAAPLLDGLPNDLMVDGVHPWENGMGANVAVSMIEGKNPMWFFDPLYGRDRTDLTPGVTHTFLVAGLAFAIRKALLDQMTITQGPQYEAYAEQWLEANPGKGRLDVPPLQVDVSDRHMIMPGRNFCEYQMRAVIEEVQDCQLEKMPVKALYLTFPFENRQPMRLVIYASKMVLGDLEPEAGQAIDAYIWLQGRIIDIDEGPQQ